MRRGRPSKYDPSMCADVVQLMAEGYSKEAVAGELEIHKDTLYEWIKVHKDFSDAIKLGESKSRTWWENIGRKAVCGEVPGFSAAAWIMTMKNMHGYRDKVEHTGEDGGAMVINVIRHGNNADD